MKQYNEGFVWKLLRSSIYEMKTKPSSIKFSAKKKVKAAHFLKSIKKVLKGKKGKEDVVRHKKKIDIYVSTTTLLVCRLFF